MTKYSKKLSAFLKDIPPGLPLNLIFEKLGALFQSEHFFHHQGERYFFCEAAEVQTRKESVLLAAFLIDQRLSNIEKIKNQVQRRLYSMAQAQNALHFFYEHVIGCLSTLEKKPKLQKKILQFSPPILNPWSEKIIRSALRLSKKEKITHGHIQMLVLSAWLHPLRQNVGSCFATAPAIAIQREQPEQFFDDLGALLDSGVLRRTYGGHQHAVPISTSWGPGILNKAINLQPSLELSESSELLFCLNQLQIIDHREPVEKQKEHLKKLIQKPLSSLGQRRLTLNELLKVVLADHYKMTDQELSLRALQVLKTDPNTPLRPEMATGSSRRERYLEALTQAQYELISFHEHPLLKTWEYTFASFAETESQFYKWNLYVSLGFDSKKPYSVANEIFQYLEVKLKEYEEKIKFHDQEYEQEYFRVKMLEKRVVDTENEHTAGWARVEFQNHLNEFNFHRKMRDSFIDKSEALSQLLKHLLKVYDELFPLYFQEVYDASMQEVSAAAFEDSPAGFRLLYKHGRQDPTLWSFVQSQEDFVNYLKEFFVHTEFEVSKNELIEPFKQEYSEIVTRLVQLVQSGDFIKAAFGRIAERYNLPIDYQDLDTKNWPYKPWCYISGGTLERLMGHYYKRENSFSKVEQKIASETELAAFVIETIRALREDQIRQISHDPGLSMQMYSPTHAFIFKPGWTEVKAIWESKEYSYTYVRDRLVLPALKFIQSLQVGSQEMHYFLNDCLNEFSYFQVWLKENINWPTYTISIKDFRGLIVRCIEQQKHPAWNSPVTVEKIDSLIYESFPLTSQKDLEWIYSEVIEDLFSEKEDREKALSLAPEIAKHFKHDPYIPASKLYEMLKLLVSATLEDVQFEVDWPGKIQNVLRRRKLMMPKPFIFADTNWPYFDFGLTVNPATELLSLWRFSKCTTAGFPMVQWQTQFNESQPGVWGVYTERAEYTSQT